MGIKSVNPFLKELVPEAFIEEYNLSHLKGHKIAIDAANWICMSLAGEHRDTVNKTKNVIEDEVDRNVTMNKFYRKIVNFNIMLLENDITPIWCWDGKAHEEKGPEREKRKAERAKRQSKVDELKSEIEKVPLHLRNPKNLGLVPDEQKLIACKYSEMVKEVKSIMATQLGLSFEETATIRALLEGLGIPSIQAENEGEMLCAQLAIQRVVTAVWSADTDNYAMGTPFLITGFNGYDSMRVPVVKAVFLPVVLAKLEITQEELREFCIMCGTDYNTNIKNYGPKKAFALLKKHKNIEAIGTNENLDISCLNHEICRSHLNPKILDINNEDTKVKFGVFKTIGREILSQYSLEDRYDVLFEVLGK